MERREHDRIASDLPAVCRVPATPHRARLVDVSRSGCRMRITDGLAVPVGSTVHLDFGPGRRISGQVMWSGPQATGLRFSSQLSTALSIALGLEPAPAIEIEPRVEEEAPKVAQSLLHHWLRRLLRRAA